MTGLSEHADRFKKILSGLVCKNLEKSVINLTYFDLLGFLWFEDDKWFYQL